MVTTSADGHRGAKYQSSIHICAQLVSISISIEPLLCSLCLRSPANGPADPAAATRRRRTPTLRRRRSRRPARRAVACWSSTASSSRASRRGSRSCWC
ncbi:hypothetical protein M6B38_281490 [Iris pallida]|uniref:Uncharacterized protein n=1 Tax=Iris pallida TaxID=29817 RepID=A0AAX6I391_IRIPA|nr:hypothetical protein M6B38_281490 [Iris pallida]